MRNSTDVKHDGDRLGNNANLRRAGPAVFAAEHRKLADHFNSVSDRYVMVKIAFPLERCQASSRLGNSSLETHALIDENATLGEGHLCEGTFIISHNCLEYDRPVVRKAA